MFRNGLLLFINVKNIFSAYGGIGIFRNCQGCVLEAPYKVIEFIAAAKQFFKYHFLLLFQ